MQEKGIDHVISSVYDHQCNRTVYAIGPIDKGFVPIQFDSGCWGCPNCRSILTEKWITTIREDMRMRSSVLYAVRTTIQRTVLSARIRRNLRKSLMYYCVHLADGALVISNGRFTGARPRNRTVFNEIREMMECGKVIEVTRRQSVRGKENPAPRRKPWTFARIDKDVMPQYRRCRSDYEIGLLLRQYHYTGMVQSLTKLGKELLQRIRTGEINEQRPNLSDLEGDVG